MIEKGKLNKYREFITHYLLLIILLLILITIAIAVGKSEDFRSAILNNISTIILGTIGLLILHYDLVSKRKFYQEEKIHLQKMQKMEYEHLVEIHKHQERMQEGILTVSKNLAVNIANNLAEDTKWASTALKNASLGIRGQSLFNERMKHFREEKEHLASEFTPLILMRCKKLIENKKHKVFLILDSGTTLFPFFEFIGKSAVKYHEYKEVWLENIVIVTNNLAGLDLLIESGRINPNYRYSHLAINCYVLPGMPVPVYSAITGDVTDDAIKKLREEAENNKQNPFFISLLTGNWIRIRRSGPPCPVPLARGKGHRSFKQFLINYSDEVYVITPLGKVFVDISKEELNLALNNNGKDVDREEYKEVDITDQKAKYVKLVSTTRRYKKVLGKHSTRVCTVLNIINNDIKEFIDSDSDKVPHMLFPFDYNQENEEYEIAKEIPHRHTRNAGFMRKFYHYPNEP